MQTKLTLLAVFLVAILAPISTAYAVYDALTSWLFYPPAVAASSAVALELIGLAAVLVTLTLRRYNAGKRQVDPAAPMMLAYAVIAGYVVVAELLTVALDETLTRWTLARGVFPLLSLVSFALAGMVDDHAARLAQVAARLAQEADEEAERKAERKAERERRKAEKAQVAQVEPQEVATPAQPAYPCGWGCGRTFAKTQSRSAHMRKCAKRNGHEPAHVSQKVEVKG